MRCPTLTELPPLGKPGRPWTEESSQAPIIGRQRFPMGDAESGAADVQPFDLNLQWMHITGYAEILDKPGQ